ncbi:hypothetical protein BDZ85DRAFT_183030, partial [Elsinoe ampelina]
TDAQKQEVIRKFNWIKDADGLAALFPSARIILYDYASAWKGRRKVKATMDNIARVLLDGLMEIRTGPTETSRPLVFIGHSMGGLVIAKTVTTANAYREQYQSVLTCTTGCLFFGTPFRGTD